MAASVKTLLHQLEINFWDALIPLLNRSSSLRFFVPRVYRLIRNEDFQDTVKLTLVLTIIGLMIGFILGALPLI